MWLAASAVGLSLDTLAGSPLDHSMRWGLAAVTALGHGLAGVTFTRADYQTLTKPIDAVIDGPSGY